ncbi:MAG: AtpZ/AtpI family protein [Myxococcales bacterium]|nr:AtpZ/AtpI family protein [Myxococcales bacterium]
MRYSAVGLEMGIAIGVCTAAGWWLGERYGHKTAYLLGGLGLGIAVAVRAIVRVAQMGLREARENDDESSDQQSEK